MKTSKYYKQMKAVMIATVVASLFWLYWTVGRTINTIYSVPLREGYESLQLGVAIGYSVFALALIAVQIIFLAKQMKSIKIGVLFDRSSAKFLMIWGLLWMGYDFCAANVGQMVINGNFSEIVIHGTLVGIPMISFGFATLYRLAADVAEENNLTI